MINVKLVNMGNVKEIEDMLDKFIQTGDIKISIAGDMMEIEPGIYDDEIKQILKEAGYDIEVAKKKTKQMQYVSSLQKASNTAKLLETASAMEKMMEETAISKIAHLENVLHCPACEKEFSYDDLTEEPDMLSEGGVLIKCPFCGFKFKIDDEEFAQGDIAERYDNLTPIELKMLFKAIGELEPLRYTPFNDLTNEVQEKIVQYFAEGGAKETAAYKFKVGDKVFDTRNFKKEGIIKKYAEDEEGWWYDVLWDDGTESTSHEDTLGLVTATKETGKVVKRGDKWCVVHCHGKDAGKVIKCFPTKKQADAMHAAIMVNKEKGKKEIAEKLEEKILNEIKSKYEQKYSSKGKDIFTFRIEDNLIVINYPNYYDGYPNWSDTIREQINFLLQTTKKVASKYNYKGYIYVADYSVEIAAKEQSQYKKPTRNQNIIAMKEGIEKKEIAAVTKKFDNYDSFRAWIKKNGYTNDAHPYTGIYYRGKRIGSYWEKNGKIEVDLYADNKQETAQAFGKIKGYDLEHHDQIIKDWKNLLGRYDYDKESATKELLTIWPDLTVGDIELLYHEDINATKLTDDWEYAGRIHGKDYYIGIGKVAEITKQTATIMDNRGNVLFKGDIKKSGILKR